MRIRKGRKPTNTIRDKVRSNPILAKVFQKRKLKELAHEKRQAKAR